MIPSSSIVNPRVGTTAEAMMTCLRWECRTDTESSVGVAEGSIGVAGARSVGTVAEVDDANFW